MWRGILVAVLIVGAIIGARQCSKAQQDTSSKAQQDTSSKAQQDTSSNEEVEICRGKNSFTYEPTVSAMPCRLKWSTIKLLWRETSSSGKPPMF